MRRTDDLVQFQQRRCAGGFGLKNIQGGPGNLPGYDGIVEGILIDNSPSRAVDDHHTVFHPTKCIGV